MYSCVLALAINSNYCEVCKVTSDSNNLSILFQRKP